LKILHRGKNKGGILKRIISIILSLLVTIIFAQNIFAQDSNRKVVKIEVLGNKIVSEQGIFSNLQTKVGSDYSPLVLSEDIKRLYASGSFKDVRADIAEAKGGVAVVFNVKEKSFLHKIVFKGNKRLRVKHLLKEMQIKENEIFDQFKLKDDIEKLKKLYAKKGYPLVEIEYALEETDNQVKVILTINEKTRIRIRKISFKGNDAFKKGRLLKLLKIKRKGWFNSGFFKKDVFEEDIDRLTAFYQIEGFIDVKVDAVIDYDKRQRWMSIVFKIDEGKQYKVGNVEFSGQTVFQTEELLDGLQLYQSEVYSENKLRMDISGIQSEYFDKGYISSSVKADTVLNPETGHVDVAYSINEGQVAYVDKVNISGNNRTKDIIIRREMRLFPGDRYNGEKLKRSRERLYNLGYFEEVSFDTKDEPTTLPDKYDLDIFVKESKTGEFSFGAGYSSVDKFIGFVDLTQRNFDLFNFPGFTGAGQKMRLRMEFGSERKDYELSFVEPWFLGYPLSTGFSIYSRTRDWDKYDEKRVGGTLFVGKELGEYWRMKTIYRYEGVRIDDVVDDASSDIKAEEGKNMISSLTQQVIHDTRDNIFNPRTGWYNLVAVEYAGGFLGGDKDFIRYETTDSKYFPIGEEFAVLELKGRFGIIEAFDDSHTVPIYERFYAGGSNTIRGYKERRVGPEGEFGDPIGGRIRALGNAELTFKLTRNLKWAFFYDIGNVWENHNQIDFDGLKLKSSIGTGIRVKTPLGPIRLDYGYALNPREGESRGRFHFAMSREF